MGEKVQKTKYYIDAAGNYVGGFAGCVPLDENSEPRTDVTTLDAPPAHGLDRWDQEASAWIPYVEAAAV